jgi:serine protease Do
VSPVAQVTRDVGTVRLVQAASWRPPVIALLVLVLIAPGVSGLHFLHRPEAGTPEATLDLQREINSSLEARIRAVRRSTENATCRSDDPAALPIRNGTNLPTAAIPVMPRNPASNVPSQSSSVDELLARLDQSTVLVIAINENNAGHGTGFFISDKILVTNQHVVSDLVSPKFYVTNAELGGLVEAHLVAKTPSSNFFSPDFAVLEIQEGKGTPLELAESAKRLETVIAAGFPGFLMQTDAAFKRMLDGDRSAVPQMAVTQGIVTARQTGPFNLAVLAHTAEISPGNSGGPLVDKCGRVVGVNTFFRADISTAARANFALEATGLRAFLTDRNIAFKASNGVCVQTAPAPPLAERQE